MSDASDLMALGMPSGLANEVAKKIENSGGDVSWDDLTNKPSTFPPSIGTTEDTAMAGNATPTPGDNSVTNAKVAENAAIGLAKLANTAAITTAGGTTIPAGNIQATLQAIADLADPGGD